MVSLALRSHQPLSASIRVLLADDHQLVLDGLKLLLSREPDIEVVGQATDGLGVLPLVDQLAPAVLVLDLTMPGLNGLDVVRQASRRDTQVRTVVLSMHSNDAYVAEALRCGALAYVLKQANARAVVEAIRAATAGRRYLSPPLSMERVAEFERQCESTLDPFDTLSTREREVLKLTAHGLTSSEVGRQLAIGSRTVETHRAHISRKLGSNSHTELVRIAVKHGLVE